MTHLTKVFLCLLVLAQAGCATSELELLDDSEAGSQALSEEECRRMGEYYEYEQDGEYNDYGYGDYNSQDYDDYVTYCAPENGDGEASLGQVQASDTSTSQSSGTNEPSSVTINLLPDEN